jgi:hypothetical protein
MGAEGFIKKRKYEIIIGCVIVSAVVIGAVFIVQMQNHVVPVFSYTEYNVKSYPYYFRTPFEVLDHPGLDAHLQVKMVCRGLSSTEDTWLNYIVYAGSNVSVLDTYRDPDNATVNWLMREAGLTLRFSASTIRISSDEVTDLILAPGNYVWVHFITSPVNATASMFSVSVSIAYR